MTGWFAHGSVQASAAAAAPFLPTDIASLEHWLDASDAGTITDTAGEVSQWDDNSTAGNDVTQATAANQGNTSTVNTNDGIFFDGTGERMRDSAPVITSPPVTIGIVFTPTSVAAGEADLYKTREGFNNVIRVSRSGDDIRGSEGQGGATVFATIANVLAVDETRWVITRWRNSGAGSSDILDDQSNSATATAAASIANADDINVAANADGTTPFAGHIHEVVYYNRFLTDTERTDLANYFNSKWTIG
jgi:hypothetical protein